MPKRKQQDRSKSESGIFAVQMSNKPKLKHKQFTLETFFELHLEVMDRRDTRAGCLRSFNMTVGDFEPMPHEEVPAAMQGLHQMVQPTS
ncbi:hypothetical protein niasHT_004260 [Heterodera trifolii]|uniref:Uncharacterized protein n=1 Tax=Heterodera trifolii TaxID=157864 RepID=A0ABD2LNQ9_9BILA